MKKISTSFGEVAANQSDGESPLFVFLHGIQGTKELFAPFLKEPFIRRHASLAIDLLGFGDSAKPEKFDYSISSFAQCVEELVRSTNTDLIFIGHSLGGMIATRLLDTKLKIKGLISLEGNLKSADCGATKEIAALSEAKFTETYLPSLIKQLSGSSEPSAGTRLSALRKADPHALYQTSRAIVAESESENLFRLISESITPTLFLVGAKSNFSTRTIPGNTKTVTISNASHFLLHDNYSAVVEAAGKFLSAL